MYKRPVGPKRDAGDAQDARRLAVVEGTSSPPAFRWLSRDRALSKVREEAPLSSRAMVL
jgi:hypothetical protein